MSDEEEYHEIAEHEDADENDNDNDGEVESEVDGDEEDAHEDGEEAASQDGKKGKNAAAKSAGKEKDSANKSKKRAANSDAKDGAAVKKPKTPKSASSGGNESVIILSESDSKNAIYNYMYTMNRPFSYLQIFENLRRVVKKSSVVPICEELVTNGKLAAKNFGKTRLYIAAQTESTVNTDELSAIDAQSVQIQQQIASIQSNNAALKTKIKILSSQPTDAELNDLIQSLEKKASEMQTKLSGMKSGKGVITKDAANEVQAKFNTYVKEWKKRKRACKEMVDTITENMAAKPAKFMKDHGLETDEEMKQNLADWERLIKEVKLPPKPAPKGRGAKKK